MGYLPCEHLVSSLYFGFGDGRQLHERRIPAPPCLSVLLTERYNTKNHKPGLEFGRITVDADFHKAMLKTARLPDRKLPTFKPASK